MNNTEEDKSSVKYASDVFKECDRKKNKKMLYLFQALMGLIVIIMAWMAIKTMLVPDDEFFRKIFLFLIAGTFIIFLLAWAALSYLKPTTLIKYGEDAQLELQEKIVSKIVDAINIAPHNFEGILSREDKDIILADVSSKLESETLRKYHAELLSITEDKLKTRTYEDQFNLTANRLAREIQSLAKRGNINLFLGMLNAVSGLIVLNIIVFSVPPLPDAISLLAHFIPRLSLVILIEIFAYFFLNLYKQSLSEIKYFQNEMTNIESKYLGLKVASSGEPNDSLKQVTQNFMETERNFILKKGESTVELEKQKHETKMNSELVKLLDKVVGKVK